MEARNPNFADPPLNVYDIKTREQAREQTRVVIEAEQRRHWDRKMRGTLGALVRNKKVEWFDIRPDTGEINPEVVAKLPPALAAYLVENDFRLSRRSQIRKESDVKWQKELKLAQEIKIFNRMKEIEEAKKAAINPPTFLKDPVLVEPKSVVADRPVRKEVVQETVTVDSRPLWKKLRDDGWGGPPRGPVLTDAEIKCRQRTIALSGTIVLFGLIVLATGSKFHISDANPANWGIFSGLRNELARIIPAPNIEPTALPTVELPSGDVIINIPPAVKPTAAPTAVPTAVPIAQGRSLSDGTRDVYINIPLQQPNVKIEIPDTQFVPAIPESDIRFSDEDPLYKSATGNGKISNVKGKVEGELMRLAGIPYDKNHISAFHQIYGADVEIKAAVDKGISDFVEANQPEGNFGLVGGMHVAKHEIVYKPADWNRSFGTAVQKLQNWYAGKMPNTASVAPNT